MHIVVNTLSITPDRGGVKTYIVNLVKGLLALEMEKRVTLLCSEANREVFWDFCREYDRAEMRILSLERDRPGLRILYDQVVVPFYCRQFENAVLLSQASTSSLASPVPEVVIVQVPLSVRTIRQEVPASADTTSWIQRLYYDTMLPLTLWRADRVVAVSDHLRQKITNLYPRAAHKVRTVHEGVNLEAFASEEGNGRSGSPSASYLHGVLYF